MNVTEARKKFRNETGIDALDNPTPEAVKFYKDLTDDALSKFDAGSDVETRPVLSSREPPPGGRPAEPARGAKAVLVSNVAPDFLDPLVRTVMGSDTPNECELPHVQGNPKTLVELAAWLGNEHCRTHREQRGQLHQLLTGGGVFTPSEQTFQACLTAYCAAYTDRDMGAENRKEKNFLGRWIGEFVEVKS